MNSVFPCIRIQLLISLRGNIMTQNTAFNVERIKKGTSIK